MISRGYCGNHRRSKKTLKNFPQGVGLRPSLQTDLRVSKELFYQLRENAVGAEAKKVRILKRGSTPIFVPYFHTCGSFASIQYSMITLFPQCLANALA